MRNQLKLFQLAQQITDEVLGKGAYQRLNKFDPTRGETHQEQFKTMPYEKDLICMRQADMVNIHPRTDFTHLCGICREAVGIFPSGQAVLASHQPGKVRIICYPCANPDAYETVMYANPELDR